MSMIRHCDRCGKPVSNSAEYVHFSLDERVCITNDFKPYSLDICRDCMREFIIWFKEKNKNEILKMHVLEYLSKNQANIRIINCFSRDLKESNRFETVSDIINDLKESNGDGLMTVRNLGKKAIKEVINILVADELLEAFYSEWEWGESNKCDFNE